MQYKLNIQSLLPGDIILVGYNDRRSRMIQNRTNSQFSHAMLYWYGSIIHASDIVITENPSRQLFEEDEQVCVLRLKEDRWNWFAIREIIMKARSMVGTYYDTEALKAMAKGEDVVPNPNRQMCSKFVAQCYDYVCIDIVDDYELCTPEDIHKSNLLEEMPNPLLVATDEDIAFAKSKDVTEVQFATILNFLNALNKQFPNEDIVSLDQLEDFLEHDPSNGDCVLDLLKQTDYFDLWRIEKEYCPYNYDVDAFKQMWKGNSATMAIAVKKESERIIEEKREEKKVYEQRIETIGDIEYYREMIALRNNIIAASMERIEVAEQVLKDFGVVKILFPWC